jgi:hypothetical protein
MSARTLRRWRELRACFGELLHIDGSRHAWFALAPLFRLAAAKRPAEALYGLGRDPEQVENVAGRPHYRDAQRRLRAELVDGLRETGDPRMIADDERRDRFPYYGQPANLEALEAQVMNIRDFRAVEAAVFPVQVRQCHAPAAPKERPEIAEQRRQDGVEPLSHPAVLQGIALGEAQRGRRRLHGHPGISARPLR